MSGRSSAIDLNHFQHSHFDGPRNIQAAQRVEALEVSPTWRNALRKTIIFAAVAGVAGFLGTSGANAMTSTSPAGVRVATEAMDTSALVHCRPYRHWHEWEHRRTFGCGGGGSVVIRQIGRAHV